MADPHGIADVLDFLDDLYRAFHPPLHDIAKYGQFVLREPQLPEVPGVELSLGGDQWLLARLVPAPPPPQVPEDLQRWLQREHLSPNVRPSVELPTDFTEEDFAAADKVEQWAAREWQPWAEKCIEVEKSRSFYKRLFALRAELEQHRDSRELLFGFGRIRWITDKGQIDHPMVTQEVDIRLESNGELTVVPDGVADVEHVYLSDLDLADRTGFHAYRKTRPAEDVDLWSRDSRRALIEDLLRRIDHDGVWEAEGDAPPQPANAARVRDEWVLFVRPRPTDFYAFTQRQRELYESGTPPSAPFTAILGAPDAGDTRHEGGNGAPEGERRPDPGVHTLFLPKPANEEQERILRLAITRPGVTAQGPPGTGKSHTIANLVSHFVADGKRVLVTSEREQALRVVSYLLPPAVRELSVAVLGSDEVSRAGLEQAIARIDQKVSTFDEASALRDAARLEGELSRIHEERAKTANDLRDARAAETLVVRQWR